MVDKVNQDVFRSPRSAYPGVPREAATTSASTSPHTWTQARCSSPGPTSQPSAATGSSAASTRAEPSSADALQQELSNARERLVMLREQAAAMSGKRDPSGSEVASSSTIAPERNSNLSEEIRGLRAQLQGETEARHAAELALMMERRRRELAESAVEDAQRERAAPFVVPALMDAFMRISQLSDRL
ncbi:hypothetical protein C8Q72DRAFT_495592 [Fomitopsis betulina]|nr:hypothetical protein C8Q72DRAFT_495592 [Fomitopsis betulina]